MYPANSLVIHERNSIDTEVIGTVFLFFFVFMKDILSI